MQSKSHIQSFGEIFYNSNYEIYVFSSENYYLIEFNKEALNNLHYSEKEILNKKISYFAPELSDIYLNDILTPLNVNSKQNIVIRTYHIRKDGSKYYTNMSIQKIKLDGSDVFLAIVNDETEKYELEKKHEDERKKRKWLQSIINSSSLVVLSMLFNEKLCLKYVSKNIDQFGYDSNELVAECTDFLDLIEDDEKEAFIEDLKQYIDLSSTSFERTIKFKHNYGDLIWINLKCDIVYNEEIEIRGFLEDIHQDRIVDEAISIENKNLEKMLSANPDWYFRVDKLGNIIDFFTSNTTNIILSPSEIKGSKISKIIPEESAKVLLSYLSEAHRTKKIQIFPFEFTIVNYHWEVEFRVIPIENEEFVAIMRIYNRDYKDEI